MDPGDISSSSPARSAVDYSVQERLSPGSEKVKNRWSTGPKINENCLTRSLFGKLISSWTQFLQLQGQQLSWIREFGQSARSRRRRKTPMQQFHRAVKQVKNMPLHWHDYYGIKCGYFHGIALPEYIYTFVLTHVFAAKACVLSLCRLWMKVICLFCVDLVT